MPFSFSDDQRRRHAARHEFLRMMLAPAKRGKREEDGACPSSSLSWVIELCFLFGVGGDLLSHNLPVAVPSACAGLASGFGMGPGVSLQLLTTDKHTKQKYPLGCPCLGVVSDTA